MTLCLEDLLEFVFGMSFGYFNFFLKSGIIKKQSKNNGLLSLR